MSTSALDWSVLKGSPEALKWNRRDIPALESFVGLCRHRRVAVQAGGNLGVFPKVLSRHFTVVHTFEPSPELFPMLVHNVPELNVIRLQIALGAEFGSVSLVRKRRDGKPNAHEGVTHVSGEGTVPMMRLDAFNFRACDLLMLDIEGMELDALRGGVETLERCRPVVALEINKNLAHVGLTERDVVGFIEAQGYRHALSVGSDQAFVPEEWL